MVVSRCYSPKGYFKTKQCHWVSKFHSISCVVGPQSRRLYYWIKFVIRGTRSKGIESLRLSWSSSELLTAMTSPPWNIQMIFRATLCLPVTRDGTPYCLISLDNSASFCKKMLPGSFLLTRLLAFTAIYHYHWQPHVRSKILPQMSHPEFQLRFYELWIWFQDFPLWLRCE